MPRGACSLHQQELWLPHYASPEKAPSSPDDLPSQCHLLQCRMEQVEDDDDVDDDDDIYDDDDDDDNNNI